MVIFLFFLMYMFSSNECLKVGRMQMSMVSDSRKTGSHDGDV